MNIATTILGKKFITLDEELNVNIKDINSGELIFKFKVKSPQISSFDNCSKNLFDISNKYTIVAHHSKIVIYNTKTGEKITTWVLKYPINTNTTFIKIYNDKIIVVNSNNEIKLFDIKTTKLEFKITTRDNIKNITILNNFLVVFDKLDSVEIFNLDKGVIQKRINKKINSISMVNDNIYCILDKNIELLDSNFNVIKLVFEHKNTIQDIKPYKDHIVLKFDDSCSLYDQEFAFVSEIKLDDKIIDMYYENDTATMIFLFESGESFVANHSNYNNQVQEYLEATSISENDVKALHKLKHSCLVSLNDIDIDFIIKKCFNKSFVSALKLMAANNNDFALRALEKWKIFEEYDTFHKKFKTDLAKYPFVKKFFKEKKYALLENIVKQHKTLEYSPEYLKYKKDFNTFCDMLRKNKNKMTHSEIIEKADVYLRVVENNRVILKILGS